MKSASYLTSSAQTAYAQVLEAALSVEHVRSVADLSGSFAAKTVKGHRYWYYQYREPAGNVRQVFVGPDTVAVRALMARKAAPAGFDGLIPLSRSAAELGCATVPSKHFRVVQRLSEYGFFKAGAVLIGTHAFVAYGNMLGVSWGAEDSVRTLDIDFAHPGRSVALVLDREADVQTHEAIKSLEMGFLPISGLEGKTGGAYLLPNEPEFRLDFLTTAGREEAPYEHPNLHVTLQPLKFMEFSLEDVQQAVLLSPKGAVVVNVPSPARYALHKLIVCGEREGAFKVKSHKDLAQAGALLSVLKEEQPGEVEKAWADLLSRGEGWSARALVGIRALSSKHPELCVDEWLSVPSSGVPMPTTSISCYGRIYTENDKRAFLEATQGVRLGHFDERGQFFYARATPDALVQLSDFPADFRLEFHERPLLLSRVMVAQMDQEQLKAEESYLSFLLRGGSPDQSRAEDWRGRLKDVCDRQLVLERAREPSRSNEGDLLDREAPIAPR